MPAAADAPHPDARQPDDPVRRRRAQVARWNGIATRIGWASFGVAIAAFAVALVTDATASLVPWIIAALVVGSVLLAPAIVIGYAVKAAERDDRERGL